MAKMNYEAEYDYIVVGSGAGGGPLAANLARGGQRVLLLEAGDEHENYRYQIPAFHFLATEDSGMSWNFFVRHYSDEAQQRRNSKFVAEHGGVLYPRAGTLGGCTAHNALITVYPHNQDWDDIAHMTDDASWSSQHMRTYFERLERCQYRNRPCLPPRNRLLAWLIRLIPGLGKAFGNESRHGYDGWLGTQTPDPSLVIHDREFFKTLTSAAEKTLEEHLGRPLTPLERLDCFDPNDWHVQQSNSQGLWRTPLATNVGRRNGTREYIRLAETICPDKLTIKTNVLATKVLFSNDNTAIGVEYLEGKHLYRADPSARRDTAFPGSKQVFAKREIILATGVFNTPQLLKLSGIGPREELKKFGIPVRVDLPGVGENLQDRYEINILTEMSTNFPPLLKSDQLPDPAFRQWQYGKGVYTSNGIVLAIIEKSGPDRPLPDLYIFGLPGAFRGYYPGYSQELQQNRNYFTWVILKAHTQNTAGRVLLKSNDPRDTPNINFHSFQEGSDTSGKDLESVVNGVEFVRRMMQHAKPIVRREVLPGEQIHTRDEVREFVRNEAWGHHASCSCKMGVRNDRMAVVDSKFRVYGVNNLRIVDASIFPRIPGFFIVTPIYMIGEKASDVILAELHGSRNSNYAIPTRETHYAGVSEATSL
ncbi:MAG TPA: GMC oxidoreductase [Ktedonobacteraceae bacterium]